MSASQNTLSHENDDRFKKPGIVAPLIIFIFSIIFTWGSTIVALLGIANWCIHTYALENFIAAGNTGVFIMSLILLLIWTIFAFFIAFIVFFFFKSIGNLVLAYKITPLILFILFISFTLPWILWPTIRRNSPTLNRKYRQKLKVMAKGPIMQQRLARRRARLQQNDN